MWCSGNVPGLEPGVFRSIRGIPTNPKSTTKVKGYMSKEANARKSEQLGMPFGTANGRLRKMILFDLIVKSGMDYCYRCGDKIINIKNFTIEHIKAWLDVDPELFWDLDNIAFSHMACNIGARRIPRATLCFKCKVNPPRYDGKGHARECTSCNSQYKRDERARKR